ncbi:MAG: S1/P1 nuclease [Pyrinomonadaceae bacterium]
MRSSFRAFARCLLLLLASIPAFAWDDTGHMVVASIAYNRLTPAAKAKVDRLMARAKPEPGRWPDRGFVFFCEHRYNPVTIACWMDDVRDSSLHSNLGEWHYINYNPLFLGIPADSKIGPAKENILVRIKFALDELEQRKNFAETNNRTDDKLSAEAFGYLAHLVGDVHQPLHAATRYTKERPNGDAGGNGFPITPPVAKGPENLHAYWDAAAGLFNYTKAARLPSGKEPPSIRQFVRLVTQTAPDPATLDWQEADPEEWVKESNRLAREFAYVKLKEKDRPAGAYASEARRIAAERMLLAGYRLADALNRIYQ